MIDDLPGLSGEGKEKDLRMGKFCKLIKFDILDYIPTGHDNAVTRRELMDQTGIKDRAIRDMIHYARRKIAILNLQDGEGYFIPDMNLPEERIMLVQYIQQDEDVLTYALFPQVATEFFKYREAQQTKVDPAAADTKNKAYPV